MSYLPNEKRTTSPLLVAILISLLVHHLVMNIAEYLKTFEEEPEEKRLEVSLADPPPPPPKPTEPVEKPKPVEPKPKRVRAARTRAPKTRLPVPAPEVQPDPGEAQKIAAQTEAPPPVPKPMPNLKLGWKGFDAVYGDAAKREREQYAAETMDRRIRTGAFGGMTGRVKTAMHRNKGWVNNSNQQALGKRSQLFKTYLEIVHDKIHVRFADGFLGSLAVFSSSDPINDPSLMAKLEFEILPNGKINEVRIIKTSGNTVFDAAAVDSLYRTSPHRPPPKAVHSWNGRVYMRWGFYRNHRKCGVFNAEPYIISAPGGRPEDLDPDAFAIDGS